MKTLFTLVCGLFISFNALTQTYSLELVSHNSEFNNFNNLLVIENEMWASYTNGPLYFNGSSWSYPSQPVSNETGFLYGIKKENGDPMVIHNRANRAYSWNNSSSSFDYFESPVPNTSRSFVFSENIIYICTEKKLGISYMYKWDGENEFEEIYQAEGQSFRWLYAKAEDNILLLSAEGFSYSRLLRYTGDGNLEELYSFDVSDGDYFIFAWTNDGEKFFISSAMGKTYVWDDSSSSMTHLYTPTSIDQFGLGIIAVDNENVFIFGPAGVKHIKASTGENELLSGYAEGYAPNISSGYFDHYSGETYFTNSQGRLYKLKKDNGNSVARVDISSQLSVYPNPAIDRIVVNLQTPGQKTAEIYNIVGARMMQLNFLNDKTEIEISALPKGVYLIKINTLAGQAVKKFVKN